MVRDCPSIGVTGCRVWCVPVAILPRQAYLHLLSRFDGGNSHWHPIPPSDAAGSGQPKRNWDYALLCNRVYVLVSPVKRHRDGHHRSTAPTTPTADGETVWSGTWIALRQRGDHTNRISVALHRFYHSRHRLFHHLIIGVEYPPTGDRAGRGKPAHSTCTGKMWD